ncbi:hypothetical protein [Paenibacillus rhizovicinus]
MAAAAYVEGIESLYNENEWKDLVSLLITKQTGSVPNKDSITNPSSEIRLEALSIRLRQLHAQKAEQLPFVSWEDGKGKSYRLLEDSDLVEHFGVAIGLIAASHWWTVDEIETDHSTSPRSR